MQLSLLLLNMFVSGQDNFMFIYLTPSHCLNQLQTIVDTITTRKEIKSCLIHLKFDSRASWQQKFIQSGLHPISETLKLHEISPLDILLLTK